MSFKRIIWRRWVFFLMILPQQNHSKIAKMIKIWGEITWVLFKPVKENMPICFSIKDQSFPLLSFAERLSNSFCLTFFILPASISISSFHSLKRVGSPTTLATILAPWTGGFEYIGRAILFSWLLTLKIKRKKNHYLNRYYDVREVFPIELVILTNCSQDTFDRTPIATKVHKRSPNNEKQKV